MAGRRSLRILVALLPLLMLVGLGRQADAADSFAYTVKFSGSGYISVPHADDLNPTTAFTIEAWIKVDNPGSCPTIISKDYTQGSFWFGVCNLDGGGTNRLALNSNGSFAAVYGVAPIPASVWTHVAVTWVAGGQTIFYINGDIDAVRASGPAPVANTRPVYIAASPSSTPFYFSGNIAELRLWNVARSQNNIRETLTIANQEKLPGLVADWNLSDNYKEVVGGHDGTVGTAAGRCTTPAQHRGD